MRAHIDACGKASFDLRRRDGATGAPANVIISIGNPDNGLSARSVIVDGTLCNSQLELRGRDIDVPGQRDYILFLTQSAIESFNTLPPQNTEDLPYGCENQI